MSNEIVNMLAQSVNGARKLLRVSRAKLGLHRNQPRVYLQGKWLLKAGFAPSRLIVAEFAAGQVTLRLSDAGNRVVAGKKDGTIPVIDVHCADLRQALGDVETLVVKVAAGEIVITPNVREQKRRARCRNGREGSICGGAGLLTKAAQLAGFKPIFTIEQNEAYADLYAANFPYSLVFNMPLDEVDIRDVPPCQLLTLGLSCEGHSNSRTLDRKTGKKRNRALPPEAHPDAGAILLFVAAVIEQTNPATIIVEEAPAWLESASGFLLRYFLEKLGYRVEGRVLDSHEYGYLQSRKRSVLIATSDDEEIRWPEQRACELSVADILDEPDAVAADWFTAQTKSWAIRHWQTQTKKGNGFAPTHLTSKSRKVGTIKRRYLAGQGDNQALQHDTEPGKWRWLTVSELRRLFTLPEDFILSTKTVSGEALGQGVIVDLFRRIIATATGRATDDVERREELLFADQGAPANSGQLALAF